MRWRNSGCRAKWTICRISSLPAWSRGMGLAGEDDLHRPLRVGQEPAEPVGVAEAAGWRACRWRSAGRSRWSGPRGPAPPRPAPARPAGRRAARSCSRSRRRAKATSRSRRRSWVRHSSASGICSTRSQTDWSAGCETQPRPEVAVEQAGHVVGEPAAHVHAVGDGGDRHLVHRHVRPEPAPHPPRHPPVQRAHAVGGRRRAGGPARSWRTARCRPPGSGGRGPGTPRGVSPSCA